jgi:hypothetical protein
MKSAPNSLNRPKLHGIRVPPRPKCILLSKFMQKRIVLVYVGRVSSKLKRHPQSAHTPEIPCAITRQGACRA